MLDFLHQRSIEILRELAFQSPSLPIFLVPLRLVGRDLRLVRRHFVEDKLANRKNGQSRVADNAHVELAAFDVFLRDGIALVFFVNERDPLAELLVVLDK